MERLRTPEELEKRKKEHPLLLCYVGTDGCGVCESDRPRVAALAEELGIPAVAFDYAASPAIRGALTVFTIPAVVLFRCGAEVHRQARILDFQELRRRTEQMKESL